MSASNITEALYYSVVDGKIRCDLCPNYCLLKEGEKGRCGVRIARKGRLYTEIYNKVTSVAFDPIEKKPLYHYHKGSYILSLGTKGCNFACPWCQNWTISQSNDAPLHEITADEAVYKAKELGSFGIAYTYNEPFIWYEFVAECCVLAGKNGLKNVFVSNGYINFEPLSELLPQIDAMNVDIKSIDESFYSKYCLGKLAPVLRNVKEAKSRGVHIEITNLVIPQLNDSPRHIARLASWVADNLGKETPVHFSRYFPCYQFSLPATPAATLEMAKEVAGKSLDNVYLGNI